MEFTNIEFIESEEAQPLCIISSGIEFNKKGLELLGGEHYVNVELFPEKKLLRIGACELTAPISGERIVDRDRTVYRIGKKGHGKINCRKLSLKIWEILGIGQNRLMFRPIFDLQTHAVMVDLTVALSY